jgi:hypothetical protein
MEKLTKRIRELEAALRPFASATTEVDISIDDLKAARGALENGE